ncbi:MAG: ImmA/IrrE family metallo-endopeptidase [Kiritimatiellia bacterium]|nr:ImmA/IrrE family metallo-endopeptidase [Kiritimatiellia bacterium]
MKAKRTLTYQPDYAIPPGETLREVMESLGMTQQELGIRTGLTVQSLNRIFKGDQPISYDTANALEMATGTPARFWNNLEVRYRERLTAFEKSDSLTEDLEWLKSIPTLELIRRGAIEKGADNPALLRNTLSFYGVSSVAAWHDLWDRPALAARRSACFETRPGPASAWIRLGELQAQTVDCQPYSKERLTKAVPELRGLTHTKDVQKMADAMRKTCAECGVALALVPEMKKVPWNGATRWLTPEKAMVLLNLRGKGEDRFWFSFFHEIGHVLHDSKKDLLINDGSRDDPREVRADDFAAETLIPSEHNAAIAAMATQAELAAMAHKLDIAPGIVAGRHQFLTENWGRFKGSIRSFAWNKNK